MEALIITPEIEADAKRIAEATGETPTEVVAKVLRTRLAELPSRAALGPKKSAEEIMAMIRSYNLRVVNDLSEEEILGLDEFGVPEQPSERPSHVDHR